MPNTWWLEQNELDSDQQKVIDLPLEKSFFITGPPGSGKTNILLLRAQYMTLSDMPNLMIIVFTRALHDFIVAGASNYAFPVSKVQTCLGWQQNLLREYDIRLQLPVDFSEQRKLLTQELKNLIKHQKISKLYDCILLDEAQDYLPEEIDLFQKLATYLFVVADSRQKIYEGASPIDKIIKLADESIKLKYHYRIGRKICRLADAIAKTTNDYVLLESFCNYDEKARPSSVESFECKDISEQADKIILNLRTQLIAYPKELLVVLCPTWEKLKLIWDKVQKTDLVKVSAFFGDKADNAFNSEEPIVFCTLHSMKGLEARAVHFAGCEELQRCFKTNNRNMTYTAVTRAKTSLSIYYSGELYGYFEKALALLNPSSKLPEIKDLFRKNK